MNNNYLIANQSGPDNMTLIYVLYGAMIIYFMYKQITGYREKKKLKGQVLSTFRKEVSKVTYILAALIVAFGIFNIVNKQYISGILMITLVVILIIDTRDSVIVTEMGIYAQGKFLLWTQIKKWAFDLDSSDLVLTYKDDMQEKNQYVKIDKNKIEELNMIIRKLKLGK
ncbi:MAG: DUF5673 domain-containing protein [Tissierellia bacterium]|nr:DUF5673 domain-containing protein [Tissierellia bacterium]